MKVNLNARDISGHNPLGIAIIKGSSYSMLKLAQHTEAIQLYVKEKQEDLSKSRMVISKRSFTLRKQDEDEEEEP